MSTRLLALLVFLILAALPARANNDLFTQIYSNPFHPLNPAYQQNMQNMQKGLEAWAKMGPSRPTFATRLGTGVAVAAVANAGVALLQGDLSWKYLGSGEFWRPVIGSVVGASVGALVPGGNMIKAFTTMIGAGLGASALSPKDQDWTLNIATAIGGAALGALMSPLPGGTFIGAFLGQMMAALAVHLYRDLTGRPYRERTPPVFGKELSLLGVSAKKDEGTQRNPWAPGATSISASPGSPDYYSSRYPGTGTGNGYGPHR